MRRVSSLPGGPVLLPQGIFDGHDGVAAGEVVPIADQLFAGKGTALLGQSVPFGGFPAGGRGIQGDHELLARLVAAKADGLQNPLDGLLVAGKVGGEPALIPYGSGFAPAAQQIPPGCGRPRSSSAGRPGNWGAHRDNHEFLDVQVVGGVQPAVDDVEQGNRQGALITTAQN